MQFYEKYGIINFNMNINIICIGNLKEKYLKEAQNEYLKRLSRFACVKVIELDEQTSFDMVKNLKKEKEQILKHIKPTDYTIALCVEAKQLSSIEFAKHIKNITTNGVSTINFIIGGSDGLDEEIKKTSDMKMSFSTLTFPHQLMRIFLVEQIYRVFKINNNENYHK